MEILETPRKKVPRYTPKSTSPPCAICGMAAKISLSNHQDERYCLWYKVRLPADEVNDPQTPLRQYCVRDGNHFAWPLRGITPLELAEYARIHLDWATHRRSARVTLLSNRIGMVIGVASLALTALGVWLG